LLKEGVNLQKLKKQMDFLIEINKLKSIFRQSLLPEDRRCENDAEHSWHMCMYAIVLQEYAPENIDMLKCLKMLLIHDLIEIYAGDTYLYDEKDLPPLVFTGLRHYCGNGSTDRLRR